MQTKETEKNNTFIQGLEKVINSLQGEVYQGLVVASNISKVEISDLRKNYETLYSQLTPLKKFNVTIGQSQNYSQSLNESTSKSVSSSVSNSVSYSYSRNEGISRSEGVSDKSTTAKVASGVSAVAGVVTSVAGLLKFDQEISSPGIMEAIAGSETISKSTATSHGTTHGNSDSTSLSESNSRSQTTGTSTSTQLGQNQTKQTEYENKTISNMLQRLDKQFERMDDFDDTSAWEFAAYFMSKEADVVEIASSTYQSVVSGDDSGIQVAAVNSWLGNGHPIPATQRSIDELRHYLSNFIQPEFLYNEFSNQSMGLRATSIISSSELAIAMGLPRHSVVGVPVIRHARFAQNAYHDKTFGKEIQLGKIYQVGSVNGTMPTVDLQLESLTGHTFITGSTGSGKSNTVYRLLSEALDKGVHFMVVEPAKGEYKNVFGNRPDVNVYGTNPQYAPLLKINPFAFPSGVHIYEHIDRLIEIFNVSWPMYAAMPAILKKAVIKSYEDVGWNLETSKNKKTELRYPSVRDLVQCLRDVINQSDYSEESKGNYRGSLVTRVESLANGLNGLIFTDEEVESTKLFDENTIIDLSRVGSGETKSLIMGILIMRLNEYRMSHAESMNAAIKHLTVLEEAHNILKGASQNSGGPEGADVAGKSVEMISNSIAEMRTYGEGFIIVDQTPSAVDSAAIRNTNTKIIMRLPDFQDRTLVGRSAALNEKQLDEVALLPKGVAVVYQNNWLEPVLCGINKADSRLIDDHETFRYKGKLESRLSDDQVKKIVVNLLFIRRVAGLSALTVKKVNLATIKEMPITTKQKQILRHRRFSWNNPEKISTGEKMLFKQVFASNNASNECKQQLDKYTGNEKITGEILKLVYSEA